MKKTFFAITLPQTGQVTRKQRPVRIGKPALRRIMQPKTKTLTVHEHETHRANSRYLVKVERVKVSADQKVMHANQGLPFYRGHAATRGVQYSALND